MKAFAELYYKRTILPYILLPFAAIYFFIIKSRLFLYKYKFLKSYQAPVPVIVVGNITLGGTGKTPLVIALIKFLQAQGYNPGVVSRGYGSQAAVYPHWITLKDSIKITGDEPYLIHKSTHAPVVIDANRVNAVKTLLQHSDCDIVVSDDGLQHYALKRDMEIIVIDGMRGFGNGFLFPAGPLREEKKRLKKANFIVCNEKKLYKNSFLMKLKPLKIQSILTKQCVDLEFFKGKKIIAIAGIGNPERFFQTLSTLGLNFLKQPMPDHYSFSIKDFSNTEKIYYIMTEKDAVKCQNFATANMFYLPVTSDLEAEFYSHFLKSLQFLGTSENNAIKV